MKKSILLTILILFLAQVSAQIDGNLLIGLTPITNTDVATITNPPEGALFYNTDEQKIYFNTASGFIKILSLDTNAVDFWSALGSTGTNSAINFLGTTDAEDMVFRANNEERIRLSENNQTVRINAAAQFGNHPLIIRANGSDIMAFQTAAGVTEWHWNLLGNGLNFVETGIADYRLFIEQGGNIGLNTGLPTERLDVDGSVRIRNIVTTSSDLDVVVTTSTGVLQKRAFSGFIGAPGTPGNDGINGNDGISVTAATLNINKELILSLSDASTINAGQIIEPKLNFGGRWTNSDISTNINVTDVLAPIFGTEDYKDDGNTLYEVIGNTLIVKEAGRYDIKVNLSYINISKARNNPSARIAINSIQIGSRTTSGYIRNTSNHTQSSVHINETFNISANDVLSIVMFREANNGIVRFSAVNETSFIINKLK